MSKRQVLMILGIWIMAFLFISFPAAWDKIFAVITGLAVIVIAFKLPPQARDTAQDIPYVENKNAAVARPEAPQMNDIIKADSHSGS
jgi:hypothetical protein